MSLYTLLFYLAVAFATLSESNATPAVTDSSAAGEPELSISTILPSEKFNDSNNDTKIDAVAAETPSSTTAASESNSTESLITDSTHKALNASTAVVFKLSDQIRTILKHFQNPDEVALPGDKIVQDPMAVPDIIENYGLIRGNFTNITVHDQSKFTIESINTDLDNLQVYVSIRMKRLQILGNYSFSGMFTDTNEGPFNVTLTDVLAEGTVYLAKNDEGRLFANRSMTNMAYQAINAQFMNSSSSAVNFFGVALFVIVKPYVLLKMDEKLCNDINVRLSDVAFRLPPSPWSPVDLAIMEGRKYVRSMGYDPYEIKDILNYNESFFVVKVDKLTVNGLSRFGRVGNVTLLMKNNTMQFGIRIMTGKLEGTLEWSYSFVQIGIMRNGSSTFSVSRVQVHAIVNQPADIRKHPELESLDIETGPITVKMDGEGSFDYIVEFVVMLLPKIIRHMIIDALEIPIRYKVQEILDNVNVEKLVSDNIDNVDDYLYNFKLDYV